MLNNIEEILEVFESIQLEKRPVLRLKVLNTALTTSIGADIGFLLSVKYHGLLACPKPKWKNASTPEEGQCKAVLSNILSTGKIDTKEFHELPLKVQTVLYYSSKDIDIGLNTNQLLSSVDIRPIEYIISSLNIPEIFNNNDIANSCPKCGIIQENDTLCNKCYEDIKQATLYSIDDFSVYGIAMRNFSVVIRDWKVDVEEGLYKFTHLNYSTETYQPLLPFQEFKNTLQLI